MRSLQRRFNEVQLNNSDLSTFVVFVRAIRNQKFTKGVIAEWFNRLVDVEDYDTKDKKALMVHLLELSNLPEGTKK